MNKKENQNEFLINEKSSGKDNFYSELLNMLDKIFNLIVRINLNDGTTNVIQASEKFICHVENNQWSEYLKYYGSMIVEQERQTIMNTFSLDYLLKLYEAGERSYSVSLPYMADNEEKSIEWLTVSVVLQSSEINEKYAYIAVYGTGENPLLKSIINFYVYNNCDYFIYLDAKNNSYTMFSGSKSGTPLPPSECKNYNTEIVKYAEEYVVPEDREMVVREMEIDNVLKKLEKQEVHSFTCGVIDPIRGYTRKQLSYRYHNKKSQMILLSRIDITDIHNQEIAYREELQQALNRAHTDFLTGLLNFHGTHEKISFYLRGGGNPAALLFIDLDNFKIINDSKGHVVGDKILRQVAAVLKKEIKADDLIGRVGGDEFVIFLKNIQSVENVKKYADELCEAVYNAEYGLNKEIKISCSIGIAFVPEDGKDYETLVEKADKKVYDAKAKGKNRFSI